MSATAAAHQWGAVSGFARPARAVRPPRRALAVSRASPRPRARLAARGEADFLAVRACRYTGGHRLTRPSPSLPQTAATRVARLDVVAGRSKAAKAEKKAAKADKKKKAPAVSKQAKDAARKKAAAAMRDIVSKQGKAYDRIVKELDRDQFREYILSVRHKPAGDAQPEAILSDWLPICEVVVADRQQYEVRRRQPAANARGRLPVAPPRRADSPAAGVDRPSRVVVGTSS